MRVLKPASSLGRAVGLVVVLAACGLACVDPVLAGSFQQAGHSRVWQAHILGGDEPMAGPVLVDHRALWIEVGRHRLRVRSLDARGHTRTIFSTSRLFGAPKRMPWPFRVDSMAAGDGRVAFIEEVIPCASTPPCIPSTYGPPLLAVALFAGRPGAIRPVLRPNGCVDPIGVGITDAGLVDYEISAYGCPRSFSRLVLRTFSGRLVRVLASGLQDVTRFVAAGTWAAFVREPVVIGQPSELEIVRVRTGQVVLRLAQSQWIDAVAIDPSGRFALMTEESNPQPCQQRRYFDQLSVGQIGHAGLKVVSTQAESLGTAWKQSLSIAGDRVAYLEPTDPCQRGAQVVIGAPGRLPILIPGMEPSFPLVFDGHLVATSYRRTVQLARVAR